MELVKVGDRVLIRPAERIPVDGEIIKGISSINQAASATGTATITGAYKA